MGYEYRDGGACEAVPRGGRGGTESWTEVGKMKKQLRPEKKKERKTMEGEISGAHSFPIGDFETKPGMNTIKDLVYGAGKVVVYSGEGLENKDSGSI